MYTPAFILPGVCCLARHGNLLLKLVLFYQLWTLQWELIIQNAFIMQKQGVSF